MAHQRIIPFIDIKKNCRSYGEHAHICVPYVMCKITCWEWLLLISPWGACLLRLSFIGLMCPCISIFQLSMTRMICLPSKIDKTFCLQVINISFTTSLFPMVYYVHTFHVFDVYIFRIIGLSCFKVWRWIEIRSKGIIEITPSEHWHPFDKGLPLTFSIDNLTTSQIRESYIMRIELPFPD